jgi:glutamate-1-semialdehyde 2,1-aminomutase
LKLGEVCKFGKNGSDATTNAIRLARAFTGKKYILIPKECPFFSTDSWFIGTTPVNGGILLEEHAYSKIFSYNNMMVDGTYIDDWICENKDVAAVIVDLATADNNKELLQKIRDITAKHGVLLIMDEIITGFRVGLRGYQGLYDIKPDLTTFAKGLGNGYAISCLAGRKDVFDHGIRDIGNTFCMSGTYFSCVDGLSAALATIKELAEWHSCEFLGDSLKPSLINAHDRLRIVGNSIITFINEYIKRYNLENFISMGGYPSCPMMKWSDLKLKTVFDYSMIDNGILAPYWSISLSHSNKDVHETLAVVEESFYLLSKIILSRNIDDYIRNNCGDFVENPVFRRT